MCAHACLKLKRSSRILNKVPQVTVIFWVIKVLATTVGETLADFLATTLHLGLTVTSIILSTVFLAVLFVQMRARKYIPALYWSVVVLISVVGTLISDNLVDKLGFSLQTTTIAFSIALAIVFGLWWYSEKTLSVHTIVTRKREAFYWATILFTFALGTSAGDLLGEAAHLGYGVSLLIFAAAIALIALSYFISKRFDVLAFWAAYILTRPLGASTGDLLSQPTAQGGLGFGTTATSFVFLAMIVTLVIYLTVSQKRQEATSNDSMA